MWVCVWVCVGETVSDAGPVEEQKEDIRVEPFSLPPNFEWSEVSLEDPAQVCVCACVCACVCVLCVRAIPPVISHPQRDYV